MTKMKNQLKGKHFLTCQDWSNDELTQLLDTADILKERFKREIPHLYLPHKTLFMIFFEQSTRTRNSMEAGMTQLGGHAHDLTADKLQVSHGESPKDTAVILSRMGHGIAVRNCFYGIGNSYLAEMAAHSSKPVMSLQDDIYHPFQAIADLMTMREVFGQNLNGLKVTVSWAFADTHSKPLSVPHSQILLFTRYGIDVTVAHPKEFPLAEEIRALAEENAETHGGNIRFTDDMDESFENAQVVIPKNWGGFGNYGVREYVENEEAIGREIKENLLHYRNWICDDKKIALADKRVKLMHALPADRGNEVTDEVIDNPDISIVYDEAENRLHTAKAVMSLTM
jgi:ornithine carbamoyltransferase